MVLDNLFPTEDWIESSGTIKKSKTVWKLKGNVLFQYKSLLDPIPQQQFDLRDGGWKVELEKDGIKLLWKEKIIKLSCKDKEICKLWIDKFNEKRSTEIIDGIHFQCSQIIHPLVQSILKENVQITTCNFLGKTLPSDYYSTLLSDKGLQMLIWKLNENLEELGHWLSYLSIHFQRTKRDEKSSTIFVVGTFFESNAPNPNEKPVRDKNIRKLALSCGIQEHIEIVEINPEIEDSVSGLRTSLLAILLGHSYFQELTPKSYQIIESHLEKYFKQFKKAFGLTFDDLLSYYKIHLKFQISLEFLRSVINFYALNGKYTIFEKSPISSSIVILNPTFLFNDTIQMFYKKQMRKGSA